MNDPFQLVTNCNFKGKDYLVQMSVLNSKKLEVVITDKIMAEDWQCEYDASYIEALTHKTGNFKQFDVFVMMLKSGLLKTSDCISLDLLTLEDLEQLRCKKIINSHCSSRTNQSTMHLNKRYLILTYSVEFDRIHYPLPLDYCGPPDPIILQSNIRRLENEIERLKHKNNILSRGEVGDIKKLKEKVQTLLEDNKLLTNEIQRLNKLLSKRSKPVKNNQIILSSLKKLEEQVLFEKNHNRLIIIRLKAENKDLKEQVLELKKLERHSNSRFREGLRSSPGKTYRELLQKSSRENSLERKKSPACRHYEEQLLHRPPLSWNNPSTTKFHAKTVKKSRNRFLSSSSSESELKRPHRARSRGKKCSDLQNLCLQRTDSLRRSSNEKSRLSSEDSKTNREQKRKISSTRGSSSQEGRKPKNLNNLQPPKLLKSRESSLSSRGSSKQSKISKFTIKASGDCGLLTKKITPRNILNEKEDIKFSMSDLEARIHSLQKLLSEGLNF